MRCQLSIWCLSNYSTLPLKNQPSHCNSTLTSHYLPKIPFRLSWSQYNPYLNIQCQVSSPNLCSSYHCHLDKCHLGPLILYSLKSRSSFTTSNPSMMFQGCNFSLQSQHSLTVAYKLHYPFEELTHILSHTSTQYFCMCRLCFFNWTQVLENIRTCLFCFVVPHTKYNFVHWSGAELFIENIKNQRTEPETKS